MIKIVAQPPIHNLLFTLDAEGKTNYNYHSGYINLYRTIYIHSITNKSFAIVFSIKYLWQLKLLQI